jgi:hypothetical protein
VSIIDSIDSAGTASLAFLEELFEQYQHDPASVPADWRGYFEALQAGVIAPVAARPASGPTATSTAETRAAVGEGGVQANGSTTNGHAVVPPSAKLVAPDGIATAHAVAIANGEVRLPEAPAGEAMPLPLPPVASVTSGISQQCNLIDIDTQVGHDPGFLTGLRRLTGMLLSSSRLKDGFRPSPLIFSAGICFSMVTS